MSLGETTIDLSDKNYTGEELNSDNLKNLPKVVSQSTAVVLLQQQRQLISMI